VVPLHPGQGCAHRPAQKSDQARIIGHDLGDELFPPRAGGYRIIIDGGELGEQILPPMGS